MLSNEKWFGAGVSAFYDETIDQSLRFEDGDSPYLERTPSTTTNRDTFTWSCWVKRTTFSANQFIFQQGANNNNATSLFFTSTNTLQYQHTDSGSATDLVKTNAVLRDTTNWYHISVTVDTTQATDSNRVRLYINGVYQSSLATANYPAQNVDTDVNSGKIRISGQLAGNLFPFDGYMAEINFLDGIQVGDTQVGSDYILDEFGETKNGVWIPKAYTGSYGTNGFRLEFADSGNLGDDTSGNTNDFTSSGLASTDVYTDSPTNNLATLNPLYEESTATLSEGNLKISGSAGATEISTIAFRGTQKFYYEVKIDSISSWMVIGILETDGDTSDLNPNMLTDSRLTTYGQGGAYYTAGSYTSSGGFSYTTNDIVGILFDNGTMTAYKNGVAQTPVQSSISTSKLIFAYVAMDNASQGMTLRFAEQDWTQAPTGVDSTYELSSTNLDDTTLSPNQTENASDYFDTTTWSGDNTDTRNITDYDFQPDWAWIKNRNTEISHVVFDSVRGVSSSINTALSTNVTDSEGLGDTITTSAQFGGISAFLTNGFTLKEGNTDDARYTNKSGSTYCGWAWKAGGTAVSNTDGTITSSISASTDAGFSITTYSGTGSLGTVGHGLGVAPDMVIIKKRNVAERWFVWHTGDSTEYMYLNESFAGQANLDDRFGNNTTVTLPSSTVLTLGTNNDVNGASGTYVAYCFAEIEGYSKFGSYTGTTQGTYVHLGFRPSWIMFKRTDSADNWAIFDVVRDTVNPLESYLYADTNASEATFSTAKVDALSNGFKWRGTVNFGNANGGNYIYMAFGDGNTAKFGNSR